MSLYCNFEALLRGVMCNTLLENNFDESDVASGKRRKLALFKLLFSKMFYSFGFRYYVFCGSV